MLLGKAGTAVATGGQISVLIDDLPTTAYPADIPVDGAFNYRSWLDGVAFIEAGKSLTLDATINRDTGQLTLSNNTGSPMSFTSLSITSASGALNAANWKSITANYDQGGGLDNDAWEITAPTVMPLPTSAPALTEIESAGGSGRRNAGLRRPRRSTWATSGRTRDSPTCQITTNAGGRHRPSILRPPIPERPISSAISATTARSDSRIT